MAVSTDADGNEAQPFDGTCTDAFAFFGNLTAEQQSAVGGTGGGPAGGEMPPGGTPPEGASTGDTRRRAGSATGRARERPLG